MNITQRFPRPRTTTESGSPAPARVSVLAELRERRAARAADRRLREELAAYNTPSAINDLLAIVARQEGPEAERIREVLADNLDAAYRRVG